MRVDLDSARVGEDNMSLRKLRSKRRLVKTDGVLWLDQIEKCVVCSSAFGQLNPVATR